MNVRLSPNELEQRIAAARIIELVDHVEDLLLLVPRQLLVVLVHGGQAEHQAFGADAIAQRFEVLVAAVLVGRLHGLNQRIARASLADLA